MKYNKIEKEKERSRVRSNRQMKELLKTVILFALLFFGLTLIPSEIPLEPIGLNLRFKSAGEFFSFSSNRVNESAGKLIDQYLSKQESSGNTPNRENVFYNPVQGNTTPLDNFFAALLQDAKHKVIRIAHYGDSQIEGDRISKQIREQMQTHFGGSGYGYVPLSDIASSISYERYASENLLKYNVFSMRISGGVPYGISGNVFKYVYRLPGKKSIDADSIGTDTLQQFDSTKTFSSASVLFKFPGGGIGETASLYFGKVSGDTRLRVTGDNGEEIFNESLFENVTFREKEFNRLLLPVDRIRKSLQIHLSSDNSTPFYGLYLDANNGVQVDNYGIRGHSGNGLLLLQDQFIQQQLPFLDTRLIILQYGGNAVPYINGNAGKQYIKDLYISVIKKLRRLMPDASILVVGVGDMAKAIEGGYRTYTGLPMVRDGLKEAAFETGCAFWDVYEMMGGANSVLQWAERGLAAKDGHFSIAGEKIIAVELVKHIEKAFADYKKRQGVE